MGRDMRPSPTQSQTFSSKKYILFLSPRKGGVGGARGGTPSPQGLGPRGL